MGLKLIVTFVRNYTWINGEKLDSNKFVDGMLILVFGWLCMITEFALSLCTLIVLVIADLGYKLGLRVATEFPESYESNQINRVESSALSMFMNLLSKVALWITRHRAYSMCEFVVSSKRCNVSVTGHI